MTRRLGWVLACLVLPTLVTVAASVDSDEMPHDVETRLRSLETTVADMLALLDRPAPPITTQTDRGFTFQRIGVIPQSSSSFAEVSAKPWLRERPSA